MSIRLFAEEGGGGAPTLLLLHGLGANAAVWDGMRPFVEAQWPGRFVIPDLRGHGRSPHAEPYDFGTLAGDVAGLMRHGEEVAVIGHSMGGGVAMALASGWFGIRVHAVLALGVKLLWSAEDLARAGELARMPARLFEDRASAIERYLRVAGLVGLVDPASSAAANGVTMEDGRHRLAADPRSNGVTGSAVADLIAAVRSPLRLSAGEQDIMAPAETLARYDTDAVILSGLGHNAHVEAPERVWATFTYWYRKLASSSGIEAQEAQK